MANKERNQNYSMQNVHMNEFYDSAIIRENLNNSSKMINILNLRKYPYKSTKMTSSHLDKILESKKTPSFSESLVIRKDVDPQIGEEYGCQKEEMQDIHQDSHRNNHQESCDHPSTISSENETFRK